MVWITVKTSLSKEWNKAQNEQWDLRKESDIRCFQTSATSAHTVSALPFESESLCRSRGNLGDSGGTKSLACFSGDVLGAKNNSECRATWLRLWLGWAHKFFRSMNQHRTFTLLLSLAFSRSVYLKLLIDALHLWQLFRLCSFAIALSRIWIRCGMEHMASLFSFRHTSDFYKLHECFIGP